MVVALSSEAATTIVASRVKNNLDYKKDEPKTVASAALVDWVWTLPGQYHQRSVFFHRDSQTLCY